MQRRTSHSIYSWITDSICSPFQLPPSSQRWRRRGPSGGRRSCRRGRPEAPKMLLQPLNPTLTLLHNSQKSQPQQTQRPPVTSPRCLNRSPRTAPASSATTPTTTPTWSRSSTSRRVAGTWRCRARVDSRRSGGSARAFPYKTKMQRTWHRGKRTYGDMEEGAGGD